ncbi:MAG TPA: PQQ-binding-like beta-propeller repeat protein [Chloroflexota bacterium]|nr:PQQ-binding-like beta-propeller repeat protein [Chloroflexota bacterium]
MHSIVRRGVAVAVAASLLVAGSAGAGAIQRAAAGTSPAASGNVDWSSFGNTSDNTRYSSLTQINTGNVGTLGLAWTAQEGGTLSAWETDPVVVNGVMYYTTNADQVRAVDAATGQLHWQYTPKVDFYHAIAGGGGGVPTNRGVTVAAGKVYLLTFDNQLIALQAATGEKLWDSQVADPNLGYSETSPGTYWNGMFFVGSAESDAGLRGFVAAYDANTGKQIWRYYTVPLPGQGWMPKVGAHGGGDVWMPPIVDTATGMVYFGTGNPSPDLNNSMRPGCNPWVDATVALDAKTGTFRWAHTEVCPDLWDYDSHQPPMIFDVHYANGKTVHAVGHGNKSGVYFVYDARTGKVLAQTGHVGDYSIPHLHPTAQGAKVCPGAVGGFEYSPPAFSAQTQYAYEPGLNECQLYKLAPLSETNLHRQGAADFGGTPISYGKTSGFMAAIDTRTGKVAWKVPNPTVMIGGAMATAGGLVFSGDEAGNFYAFDAKSGKILWKAATGLAFGAAPITYEVHGTQYVAIATGGAAVAAILGGKTGGTLAVFKLHGKPVNKALFPAAKVASFSGGVTAKISTKGMTKINPWMYANTKQQTVTIMVTAGATADNNGFNFDGYSKGKVNFVVPAAWTVNWIFSNPAAIPHSAALTMNNTVPPKLATIAGAPVETPNAQQGIAGAGKTQYLSFPAVDPGKYYLVCLVPGHLVAGMWDYFTISTTAKAPSLQTT